MRTGLVGRIGLRLGLVSATRHDLGAVSSAGRQDPVIPRIRTIRARLGYPFDRSAALHPEYSRRSGGFHHARSYNGGPVAVTRAPYRLTLAAGDVVLRTSAPSDPALRHGWSHGLGAHPRQRGLPVRGRQLPGVRSAGFGLHSEPRGSPQIPGPGKDLRSCCYRPLPPHG